MPKLAFIGLGSMGKPMASQLLAAGYSVTVHNRSQGKADGLAGEVRVAGSPAEAAAGADIVMTMVADDAASEAVTLGPQGLLAALGEKSIHVSMSTISVALSRRLAEAHAKARRGYIAAPVFGRPDVAAAGNLRIVAAGPAELVDRCRPVLQNIGQQVTYLGEPAERANVFKLAGNFTIAAMLESLGEAMALVRKAGIPPAQFLEVINGGLFKSPVYENYGGMIVGERYEPAGFRLRLGLKDAGLVLAAAADAEVPMPVASVVHGNLLSGVARGKGDMDWSVLARVIAENAGLKS